MNKDITGFIDKYTEQETPPISDWDVVDLLDDIIMCEYADADSEGHIKRNGLYVSVDVAKHVWRIGLVKKVGDKVSKVKVGNYVMFPNDKGIPCIRYNEKPLIFLNEDRIFAVVEPHVEYGS